MKKYIDDFKIVKKISQANSYFTLVLQPSDILPEILPGQFVEIKVENHPNVFLRRPISIHDVDYKNNTLSLFIQIVGKGTSELSKLAPNDTLNLVYPLGRGYSVKGTNVLLIGGGCGVAPLLYLGRKFKEQNVTPQFLFGARSASLIPCLNEFKEVGTLHISTEDGSMGEKGLLTTHSVLKNPFDYLYTCGPNGMMKAIARYALDTNIPCELSLENTMACGIGACLCCVVNTNQGHKCVCSEGPVFEANELKNWIEYGKEDDILCNTIKTH